MLRLSRYYYYRDLNTGELLTACEMLNRAEEWYDFDDYTNALELWDYFELTDYPIA